MFYSPSKSLKFGEIKNEGLEVVTIPPNPQNLSPSSLKKHSNKVIKHTLPPSTLLPPSKQAITEFNIKSK